MPGTVETNNASTNGISTTMQKKATGAYSFLHRSLDAYFPPSTRQDAYDAITAFASERPILFVSYDYSCLTSNNQYPVSIYRDSTSISVPQYSYPVPSPITNIKQSFLVAQALLASIPLLLFATFSLSTLLFALGAALIFSLFWIGTALLVLVSTLLLTSSLAVLVWAWAVGSFLLARSIYQRAPFGVNGELHVDAAGKKVTVVKDEKGLDGGVKNEDTDGKGQ
jgi:hypothetical protein